ncbi:archease [Halarchaeum sp. P4]|uniref:archease n=1 Tax=Halarchaeum sp. P4 TaxID=3421639 RepID=UPI003EBACF0C
MSRTFELREHTADVAVEARAESLGGVFAAVADGMAVAMCDEIPDADAERFDVTARASTRKRLLFDYLDALIYERDVRGVLPVEHEASVTREGSEWVLAASAAGIPLDEVAARDLKAVTFSEMRVEETADGWEAYVVFDV